MSNWVPIEKDAAHVARERAKARELRQSDWWRQQLRRGVCHYCGRQVGAEQLTMDHVIPVVRGGRSTRGNVVPACRACNQSKRAQTPAEMILESLRLPEEAEPPAESTTEPRSDRRAR
jgi:5-methylcytosine-specific restriction endonuclease McrA